MSIDCLFCKIVNRDIPSDIIYEDENVIAFNDINPQAPVHQLIIPRQHIATLNDVSVNQKSLIGHMLYVAKDLAGELNLADSGYRIVMNCNNDGGQEVFHIHFHLLGGRQMTWPPG